MPEVFKCKYCGKEYDKKKNKNYHERMCKLNPNSPGYKPKAPPKDEAPPKEKSEDISLGSLGVLLKSFGIKDGADLVRTIDGKARQMPFFAEIIGKFGEFDAKIGQLDGMLKATNKGIDSLIENLNKRATEQAQIQPATQPTTQPATQPLTEKPDMLAQWFDRGLKLMELGGHGGGNPNPETKYKELVEVLQLVKAVQPPPVDTHKQMVDMANVVVNIAKAFKGVSLSSSPEERIKPPKEYLEE